MHHVPDSFTNPLEKRHEFGTRAPVQNAPSDQSRAVVNPYERFLQRFGDGDTHKAAAHASRLARAAISLRESLRQRALIGDAESIEKSAQELDGSVEHRLNAVCHFQNQRFVSLRIRS